VQVIAGVAVHNRSEAVADEMNTPAVAWAKRLLKGRAKGGAIFRGHMYLINEAALCCFRPIPSNDIWGISESGSQEDQTRHLLRPCC